MEDYREGSAKVLMDLRLKRALQYIWECPERWLPALIVVIFVSFWELLSRSGTISRLFFPPPSIIMMNFFAHLKSGELASHFGATVTRVFFSLLLGGAPALILGLINQGVQKFIAVFGHGSTDIGQVLAVYEKAGVVNTYNVRNEVEGSHYFYQHSWNK